MAIGDTPHRKLTYEDFLAFPEDGKRHEILHGEHYVTPAPTRGHQVAVRNLTILLGVFLRSHPLGELLPAPFDVIFSNHDIAEPDLLFISNRRGGILTEKNAQGAPDLVIEVLSDSTRRVDQGIKRAIYERCGVEEYWLADPKRRTVRVLRRDGPAFGPPVDLAAEREDVLTTPLLPGLEIPVGEIFD
jgi:Uma2 family endonuclease